ncbi:glycosyltransferase family 4 protein [Qipengyuania sp. MTN3-11]|uniref:glycosyltransferase family 4 protein n=1 Tax=Qipengyuania sp. MTN3-11 TaxID=3056557 RepID=UPI0036F1EB66
MAGPDPQILLLPRYSDLGPSSRLRMSQFVPALHAAGFDTQTKPFFSDRYLERFFAHGRQGKAEALRSVARRLGTLSRSTADVFWIEKEVFPFLPAIAERQVWGGRTPYVLDFDDAIFHNYDQSGSAVIRALLGDKLRPLIANSASVIVGNEYLADYVVRAGARDVAIVPTVVDPARYPIKAPPDDGCIRIGWIGTPRNARYLAPVVAALNGLADRLPLRLVTIGANGIEGLAIPQDNLVWSEEQEGELLSGIDIGVMPLPDNPFERGKCGYKLIQYMAAGKPVIASPVGVNSRIVTDTVGRLARDTRAWSDAIEELAGDADLRQRMGAAARCRVEDEYSIAAAAPVILRKFGNILGNGGKVA